MELKQAIESRVSVRSYKPDHVPFEDVKEIIRLGSLAPSVNNYQPWEFIAISNQDVKDKMAYLVTQELHKIPVKESRVSKNIISQVEWFSTFFENAPWVVAVCMKDYESVLEHGTELNHDQVNEQRNHPDLQSAGACIQNMLLGAVDKGYGACWMSAPLIAKDLLCKELEICEENQLIAFVTIGIPAKDPIPKPKQDIESMLRLIK